MSVINQSTFAYGLCIPDLPAHFHSGVSATDNTVAVTVQYFPWTR